MHLACVRTTKWLMRLEGLIIYKKIKNHINYTYGLFTSPLANPVSNLQFKQNKRY